MRPGGKDSGSNVMKDKRYGAYILLSVALFILYFFLFDGRSFLLAPVASSSGSLPESVSVRSPDTLERAESFPGFPLDLNAATAEELTVLPGIGPAIARRIVAQRGEVGGFNSVDDLLEVKWIGRVKLETVRSLVTVTPNGSGAEE